MRRPSHTRWLLLLLMGVSVLGACGAPAAPADGAPAAEGETVLTVSGAFALFPLLTVWAEAYGEVDPSVRFDVQAGGAGKGMTDVLSGAADIAMLSREARAEELEQGAVLVPVTVDSVLATANAANPHLADLLARGISSESGAAIWLTGESTTWGQLLGNDAGDAINVYTRSDASGAAEQWARFLGGEAQEELLGTAVNGDPGLAEAIRQDPLGIGYNNVGFAYDPATGAPIAGLAVVPIDVNGDGTVSDDENFYASRDAFTAAVAEGLYPYPPARILYLVTDGAPSPAITAFYRWVLTEGQQYVGPAGYVPLKDEQIQAALAALGE